MPNPAPAYREIKCPLCDKVITKGEDVFFEDGDKFCRDCAENNDNVCNCGQYKRENYKTCFDCKDF